MSLATNEASTPNASAVVAVNSQEPDAALVDAARRRDPEAFKELVTRYGPRIFRLAQKITRNREDAEEVTQDSFTRAFLHMDTFRGDSRFYTWLTRIAINQSLMKLRRYRSEESHFDRPATIESTPQRAEVADETPTPEQRYSQEEFQRIFVSAMTTLPLTFREVLQLRAVEERSTKETARILGLSISAVKSRALRGRQAMRQALTKYFRQCDLAHLSGGNPLRGTL
jgi:RNA polymerase sigma-70 factor (ECF subfamily)